MNRGHGSGRGCDGKHASTGDGARPEGGRARAASAGRRLGINTRMRLIRSNNCARARPPLPPASRLAILFALLNPLAHSLQPPREAAAAFSLFVIINIAFRSHFGQRMCMCVSVSVSM